MKYVVLLCVVFKGASVGSTRDVIEADTPEQAECKAVEAWKAARPGYGFQPLWTSPAPASEPAS